MVKKDDELGGPVGPEIPKDIPQPNVPAAVPTVPAHKTLRGRAARLVLSREEWDLYVETWNRYFADHPDYDQPEDQDDVSTVCMETALQFRLQLAQRNKPDLDISVAYNQAFLRMQKARENLAARRVDRVGTKAKSGTTNNFNVAVMAGAVTPEQRQTQIVQRQELDLAGEAKFLEGTVLQAKNVDQPKQE